LIKVYQLPDNFLRLWQAHDELIPWATEKISDVEHLKDHVDLISTYMTGVKFAQESSVSSARHTAICGLLMRSFEMLSIGLRSCLSGSYHASAMAARDLIETAFLLDFLLDQPGEPERWLIADLSDLSGNGKYSPRKVREYLDQRDGYTERKRKKHFDMLSTLGAHPTPYGFSLRRDGHGNINLGPFKQADLVRECIEELAKCTLSLMPSLIAYIDELPDYQPTQALLSLRLQKTRELYFRSGR
jgi:hypothetical protein